MLGYVGFQASGGKQQALGCPLAVARRLDDPKLRGIGNLHPRAVKKSNLQRLRIVREAQRIARMKWCVKLGVAYGTGRICDAHGLISMQTYEVRDAEVIQRRWDGRKGRVLSELLGAAIQLRAESPNGEGKQYRCGACDGGAKGK
ncbi:MAG: hypothetical protein AMXMBFR7_19440 [Planctomycetota bacterium]